MLRQLTCQLSTTPLVSFIAPSGPLLSSSAVDRYLSILVDVRYNQFSSSDYLLYPEMVVVDAHETKDALFDRLRKTFISNVSYVNGGNLPILATEEKKAIDNLAKHEMVCEMVLLRKTMLTNQMPELKIRVHAGNVRAVLIALAANVTRGYLLVHFNRQSFLKSR